MSLRQVIENDLGAWLIKGNADRADLAARFAVEPRIDRWCVQAGYRARSMRAGQPVVFWASGSRGRLPYGVWGLGHLAGPAEPDPQHGQWSVPLDLVILPAGDRLPREQLRADLRLAGLEVLRQPQAGNPSFLTQAQFSALRDLLQPAATSSVLTGCGLEGVTSSIEHRDERPDRPLQGR
jgi:hypothetical protein